MKLSSLQQRVLRFIKKTYPIVYDKSDANEIIAIGERPLATEDSIRTAYPSSTRDEIKDALKVLKSFQYISDLYLHHESDYVEQSVGGGKKVRHIPMKQPEGHFGYQITQIGVDTVNGFFYEMASNAIRGWLRKLSESYASTILSVVAGMIIWAVFGVTIQDLYYRLLPLHSNQQNEAILVPK